MIGIYQIRNTINNKKYIGKSIHIEKRTKQHFQALRSGRHLNQRLQKEFDYYGKNSFVVDVLRECHRDLLERYESIYCYNADAWNPNKGYNIEPMWDFRHISLLEAEEIKNNFLESLFSKNEAIIKQKGRLKIQVETIVQKMNMSVNDVMVILKSINEKDCIKYKCQLEIIRDETSKKFLKIMTEKYMLEVQKSYTIAL